MARRQKDGTTPSRVRRRKGQPLSVGNLSTFQDIINARRLLIRVIASGEMDYRVGNVVSAALTGLRKDMEADQDRRFEDRIAAYEQAAMSGQTTLDRPADTSLQ